MGLNLEVSFDQLLGMLLQLPPEEKILMAERLKAAAAEKWQMLSKELPDAPQKSMEEIVAEVKAVRKERRQRAQ
ncbi:MAG: hypothetical protein ACKVT2_10745 [Saprospiraceae bacterium]